MIKLADHVEEIKEMIRNTTPEELTAFMRERGYDFTFEDPNKEDEPMTALDLTHLETLLAAATPGPWEADHNCTTFLYSTEFEIGRIESGQDADLIIALRNAAPALIARVRELENPQIATVVDWEKMGEIVFEAAENTDYNFRASPKDQPVYVNCAKAAVAEYLRQLHPTAPLTINP